MKSVDKDLRDKCELIIAALVEKDSIEPNAFQELASFIRSRPDLLSQWEISIFLRHLEAGDLEYAAELTLLFARSELSSKEISLDKHPAKIVFPKANFCFTGEFIHSRREQFYEKIGKRDGIVSNSVSRKTDFLIVGTFRNLEWLQAGLGRKVMRAMELRTDSQRPTIISEQDFVDQL